MDLFDIAVFVKIDIFYRLVIVGECFECRKRFENLSDLDHCCNVHGIQWSEPTVALLKAKPS